MGERERLSERVGRKQEDGTGKKRNRRERVREENVRKGRKKKSTREF